MDVSDKQTGWMTAADEAGAFRWPAGFVPYLMMDAYRRGGHLQAPEVRLPAFGGLGFVLSQIPKCGGPGAPISVLGRIDEAGVFL